MILIESIQHGHLIVSGFDESIIVLQHVSMYSTICMLFISFQCFGEWLYLEVIY